jgi:hypothetical protein
MHTGSSNIFENVAPARGGRTCSNIVSESIFSLLSVKRISTLLSKGGLYGRYCSSTSFFPLLSHCRCDNDVSRPVRGLKRGEETRELGVVRLMIEGLRKIQVLNNGLFLPLFEGGLMVRRLSFCEGLSRAIGDGSVNDTIDCRWDCGYSWDL